MEKDTIIKIAEELYQEAFDANAYFMIMEQYSSLYQEYKEEIQLSPAFYSIMYQAIQKACFMEIAKLFDMSKNAVSVGYLLQISQENINFFPKHRGEITVENDGEPYTFQLYYQHCLKPNEECFFKKEVENQREIYKILDMEAADTTQVQVNLTFAQFLELYQKRFHSLSKKQNNIREQRNKIYAHNDKERIMDEDIFLENHLVFYSDLKEMIEFALDSIGLILGTLTGTQHAMQYSNIDDWKNTLYLAHLGIKYQEYDLQCQMKDNEQGVKKCTTPKPITKIQS